MQGRGCVCSLSFLPGICSRVGCTHSELQKLSLGTRRDHREPSSTPSGSQLFYVLHSLPSVRINAILCETQFSLPASASPGAFGQLGKGPDYPLCCHPVLDRSPAFRWGPAPFIRPSDQHLHGVSSLVFPFPGEQVLLLSWGGQLDCKWGPL